MPLKLLCEPTTEEPSMVSLKEFVIAKKATLLKYETQQKVSDAQ